MLLYELLNEMRPDSPKFDRLDSADKWLAKYTYENLDKWPGDKVLATLVKRYPVKAGTVVYRGINFSTKEMFDQFMDNIQGGKMDCGGITSWATTPDTASQFAITQPTYFLNAAVMNAHAEMENNKERLSGYRGLILELTLSNGHGIDVNASRLGHEDEIIVIPGTYQVRINKEVKQFKHEIEDGADPNSIVLSMTKDDMKTSSDKKQFFDYVLHHHANELNDKAKDALFKLARPKEFWHHEDQGVEIFNPGQPKLQVWFAYNYFHLAANGFFNQSATQQARLDAKRAVLSAIKLYDQYPNHILSQRQIQQIAKFGGVDSELTNALKKKVGAQYAELEKSGRDINNIADPRKRQDAMRNHADKVKDVLGQLA